MANKSMFASAAKTILATNTTNNAGGRAYKLSSKIELANICCAGCFNDTFYVSAQMQLDRLLELCQETDFEFLCKVAIYSRESAFMKDMPAFILAYLAANIKTDKDMACFKQTFFRICDNIKMVRNFVQIIRSGAVGRKSLGSMLKHMIIQWMDTKTDEALFKMSIGNDPSLADVIKLTHPHPTTASRNAVYGYLIGKEYDSVVLPNLIKEFEIFKKTLDASTMPNVPYEMLTALPLSEDCWKKIAENATWTQTRMNLETFVRHNVFNDKVVTQKIVAKLTNADEIRKSKVFPYQLLTAYNKAENVPNAVKNALQQAMEVAVENVPKIDGQVYIFVDVSASMNSPVTGSNGTATTKATCVDVAALIAAAFLRKNPNTVVLPFERAVRLDVQLNGFDAIMTNANKLSKIRGGGTNCGAPLEYINGKSMNGDLIIYCSDNESNISTSRNTNGTAIMKNWKLFKARNPKAKLVTIDMAPNSTSQTSPDKDILEVGGFSDSVFNVIKAFVDNKDSDKDFWVKHIMNIDLF